MAMTQPEDPDDTIWHLQNIRHIDDIIRRFEQGTLTEVDAAEQLFNSLNQPPRNTTNF